MTEESVALDAKIPEKNKAIQVLDAQNVKFEHPHPEVYVAKIPIANASWINTTEGTVLIDTLTGPVIAEQMKKKIQETGGPVKTIIYTHHHGDHVGGASVFLDQQPEIIAQRFLLEDFEKYKILREHRARIASVQFNIPYNPDRPRNYVSPTKTFCDTLTFSLGGKTFELYHARAETDDAVWVFVPEIKTVFVGDLIIAGFPNIGNPFKPTRFALPWARALEAVRAKEAEMLIAHGGRAVYQGAEVRELLDVTIEAIYSIHDQVVDGLNKDIPVEEMIHRIKLPDHLQNNKYLQFVYSRPEFAVYNIYRWYHGYYDHNPAHLLPRPDREVNAEIFNIIGSAQTILDRSKALFIQGKAQLALQVLDILFKYDPEHVEARKLHLLILETLCDQDYCLMSRNSWVYAMEKDKKFLESLSI
ncbi:MAG: MBL fold metallo-hydrolase [Deltaproteobacteria bacterium]|nr:MBL fold metallo-hydrolase [Deltaproteobacteria bacterium]